jgi:Fur family transcriptional regulator, ferric uptake regulator
MTMLKLKEESELLHSYLRQNGLKKTYQKDLILETFLNAEGHLSVDDIYALVKKRDKRVGVVTVFRTLKSLTACGIAREVNLGDGVTRFEHSYQHPSHHHIVCVECHNTIEYACPALDRIQDEIIQKYRFQPLHHRFQTYGFCEDCREHRPALEIPKQDTQRIFARDALNMILYVEARFLEFYRDSSRRNQDAGGKEIFDRMIQEEEKHIADLSRQLEELLGQEKFLDHAPIFLHFDPSELEALIPDLWTHAEEGDSRWDAHVCIDLILDLNRKTSDFFTTYAGRFSETQGKWILLSFAGQENEHSDRLRQRIKEIQDTSDSAAS